MKKRRGLTFLELLLAMMIAFLAVSFLMGLFVSGARAGVRSREISTANLLAQGAMERLLVVPVEQIQAGVHQFGVNYPGFTYTLDVTDPGDFDGDGNDDEDLKVVTMTVTTPIDNFLTFTALRRKTEPYMGACAKGPDDHMVFSASGENSPLEWSCGTTFGDCDSGCVTPLPPMPGGQPGDVAFVPTTGDVWVVDQGSAGIRRCDSSGVWWPAVKPPIASEPCGLATDTKTGDVLWMTDLANKCLWSYAGGVWTQMPAPAVPLTRPQGVAVNEDGTQVWVSDKDSNSLRCYRPGIGWDAPYTDPGLREPEGVAVTPDGQWAFAADATKVFVFPASGGGGAVGSGTIDGKAQTDYPAGMCVSADGTILYLNTRRGSVWGVDISSDLECVDWECLWWTGEGY